MGCCRSRQRRASPIELVVEDANTVVAKDEEALELGKLVTEKEKDRISSDATIDERLKHLQDLVDGRPAKISAVNLAGDIIAQLELSVNATVGNLESCICKIAEIDEKAFMLTIAIGGALLTRQQKLRDVGVMPEEAVVVSVVKANRPKPRNPDLDRMLFQEAWMGGGMAERVRALLEQNADPNGYTYADGDRAIHVTAGRGYVDIVRLLLEARADINTPGVAGMTPLQRCSQRSTTYWKGRHPAVQQLLQAHAAANNC